MGSCEIAKSDINKSFNRYPDIVPYDLTRVILNPPYEPLKTDYINASIINVEKNELNYSILTQGPLEKTKFHFWNLVFQVRFQKNHL